MGEGMGFTAGKRLHVILMGAQPDMLSLILDASAVSSPQERVCPVQCHEAWQKAGSLHRSYEAHILPHGPKVSSADLFQQAEKLINDDDATVVIAMVRADAMRKTVLDVLAVLQKYKPKVRRVLLISGNRLPENHVHSRVSEVVISMTDFEGKVVQEVIQDLIPLGFGLDPEDARTMTKFLQPAQG